MTTALKPSEAPWGLAIPDLPRLTASDADLTAHNDLARVVTFSRTKLTDAQTLADALTANPHLSDAGKRAQFTDAALPMLQQAAAHRAALETAARDLEVEAATLTADAANPPTAAPIVRQERLALAEAFGRLSREEKTRAIEAAMTGQDPALADALAWSHRLVTGLGEPIQRTLRAQFTAAHVDHAARARLETRAHLLRDARALLDVAVGAIESAADRSALKAAQLATQRRSDLTDAQKAEYIGRYGLDAFKALPA